MKLQNFYKKSAVFPKKRGACSAISMRNVNDLRSASFQESTITLFAEFQHTLWQIVPTDPKRWGQSMHLSPPPFQPVGACPPCPTQFRRHWLKITVILRIRQFGAANCGSKNCLQLRIHFLGKNVIFFFEMVLLWLF